MSLDLYGADVAQTLNKMPGARTIEPGVFDGFFRGAAHSAAQTINETLRAASQAGAVVPIAIDKMTGGTTAQDRYFRFHNDYPGSMTDFWKLKPGEVGEAGQIAGRLVATLGQIVLSPSLAVATLQLGAAEDLINEPGVSATQALAVGATQAVGLGLGIWAPPALGSTIGQRIAAGAGINWFQGVTTRGASQAILEGTEAAKQYPAFGIKEQAFDVLLGAAFGAAAHYVPPWRAETTRATDALVKGARNFFIPGQSPEVAPLKPGMAAIEQAFGMQTDTPRPLVRMQNPDQGYVWPSAFVDRIVKESLGPKTPGERTAAAKAVTEALDAWAGTLKPSDFSAMAGLRVAQHLNLDSQPGDPSSPVATNAHVEAMVSAVNSLLRGEPVNVPAAAIITPERAAEIETAAAKIDVEADAMQIRADEARVVDMETAAPIDAQVAEMRAQATATRQQGAGFVTNPVRDAENQAMVATMTAQAARIADQEGLPRAPYIIEPVETRVTRDLIAAGRSPEEAALTAKLVGLAMESTAKTAKMDPDVLFDQHYGGMTSRTGEPAEPALNQKAYRPRPADYIAEHKPTRMRDKASGLPGFKNQHMAMAGTEAMGGPQIDGSQRYSWRLYDLTNGRATEVGFVIADMRPDGSFKALRNIKIEDALQGMGMGEKTVASMLAHNGAKRMDIVDITSAGHVGTDLDALPFWKSMGTQLVNISSDPNVPMNGILSLEDYLRARSIHGPGNRNQVGDRGAAQAPAAGEEPGGGSGRGGPAGGGTAASVVRQPRAGYGSKDPYTDDLFGAKLPIPASAPAAAASAPGATPLRDTPVTPGTYHVNTRITSAGERQIGATVIKDDRDLAQATAYLYKSAVERFDAIVTDKDGKPLAVVGSFKGAIGQTSVYPSTLMAEAIRVEGAAKIWFSHNHPSGNASLSGADERLHQVLVDVFKGSGIEPGPLIAVSRGRWSSTEHATGTIAAPDPAGPKVNVVEREQVDERQASQAVQSPETAKTLGAELYANHGNEPGIMLLDSTSRLVAYVPITADLAANLRGTGGAAAVFRGISESNAASAVIVHAGQYDNSNYRYPPAQNLGALLNAIDVTPLDIVDVKAGTSAATRGRDLAASAFFQRAGHSSPHTFDKFSLQHMGSGENQQMYGWGGYFWTNPEVGKWYLENFRKRNAAEATMIMVDQATKQSMLDQRTTDITRPLVESYLRRLEAGEESNDAWKSALLDHPLDDGPRHDAKGQADEIARNAVHLITGEDSPAYRTPNNKVVHAKMSGEAKSMAQAISLVSVDGYTEAVRRVDQDVKVMRDERDVGNDRMDLSIAEMKKAMSQPFEAVDVDESGWGKLAEPGERKFAVFRIGEPTRGGIDIREDANNNFRPFLVVDRDSGYILAGPLATRASAEKIQKDIEKAEERTGRYHEGDYIDTTAEGAIAQLKAQMTGDLARWEAVRRHNDQRVIDGERVRANLDEITKPAEPLVDHNHPPGTVKFYDRHPTEVQLLGRIESPDQLDSPALFKYIEKGQRTQNFPTREAAMEFGMARARAKVRELKPGYEPVKLEGKPARKYEVDLAPEPHEYLDWDKNVPDMPQGVQAALERMMDPGTDISFATGRNVYYDLVVDARRIKQDYWDGSRYDNAGIDYRNMSPEEMASKLLLHYGIPGIKYWDGSSRRAGVGTHNFVIFDDSLITIKSMEQKGNRGYMSIGADGKKLIGLLESADPTTATHEFSHFFLEVINDLAKTVPAMAREMDVLYREWGITKQEWDGWTLHERRQYHEQFAEGFEVYVATNRAPTPELRNVFQRFRQWMLDVYKSVSGIKVSAEMRSWYDRMLNSDLRDPIDQPATAQVAPEAESPPPPRSAEAPPGPVDPFADLAAPKEAYVPKTLDDQPMREMLREMVEQEAGWAQVGGKNLGGATGIFNRSTWIPKADWYPGRPKGVKEADIADAVARALVGDRLKPAERRLVDYMAEVANARLRLDHETAGESELLAADLTEIGAQPTMRNIVDVDAVTIAAQIDDGAVERLALQYVDDDAGFMAEIRRLIDEHQNATTALSSDTGAGPAPKPAQPATAASEPTAPANGATSATGPAKPADALTLEAQRVAADNPELTMEIDMPDGTTRRMTAAQYLADAQAEAAKAREEVGLLDVAVQCLLGHQ